MSPYHSDSLLSRDLTPLAFKGRTGPVTAESFAEDVYQERRINIAESSLSEKEMKNMEVGTAEWTVELRHK